MGKFPHMRIVSAVIVPQIALIFLGHFLKWCAKGIFLVFLPLLGRAKCMLKNDPVLEGVSYPQFMPLRSFLGGCFYGILQVRCCAQSR